MPCDTIQISSIEFLATSTDVDVLAKALKKMGFTVQKTKTHLHFSNYSTNGTYAIATGKIEARGYSKLDVNQVKQQYSEEVVNNQAEQFGWEVSWSTNPETGEREAEVVKHV